MTQMNPNRGSEGGGVRTVSTAGSGQEKGRTDAEVVYVGRASFWIERDIALFQEMPDSPWPTLGVSSAAEGRNRGAGAVVSSPSDGDEEPLLGINLSGPIVLQAGFHRPVRGGDSIGTPLPAGEVAVGRAPRLSRWPLPPIITSLMIGTVLAFSLGLVASPLGDSPAHRRGGTRTTILSEPVTPDVPRTAATTRPTDDNLGTTVVPLVVTTAASRAESWATKRPLRSFSNVERPGKPKKHGAARRGFSPGSARPSVVAARPAADDGAADDDLSSRKAAEKESIDSTKQSAPADQKAPAKPWVDPWAD